MGVPHTRMGICHTLALYAECHCNRCHRDQICRYSLFFQRKKPMRATNPMFEVEGQGSSAFRHHPPFRFSLSLHLFRRRLGAICLHCNDASLLSNKPKQHPRRRQNRGEKATPNLESFYYDLVNHVRFCRSKIKDMCLNFRDRGSCQSLIIYRVTIQVVTNLLLTSKQNLCFSRRLMY